MPCHGFYAVVIQPEEGEIMRIIGRVFFLSLVFFLSKASWGALGISLQGGESICAAFLSQGHHHADLQVNSRVALNFFRKHGRYLIPSRRMERLENDLTGANPGITLAFAGDEIYEALDVVPNDHVNASHNAHMQARQHTANALIGGFGITGLLSWVGLAQLGVVGELRWYYAVGLGALSIVLAERVARWIYGPSYGQFLDKLSDRLSKSRERPLAFGHSYNGTDRVSFVAIEMLYGFDEIPEGSRPRRVELPGKQPILMVNAIAMQGTRK